MNTHRIRTIVDKEWAEVFKNRLVLFTVIFLPLIFTIMPIVILYFTGQTGMGGDMSEMPPQFIETCGSMSPDECAQYFLLNEFLLLFMMMPLLIPTAIAAYSIVGEKTTRSLEPLLATPITTEELLTGKALAAAIPAIIAGWAAYFIFVAFMPVVGASANLINMVFSPTWLIAILVIGPLMAVASVNVAIIISSRVNDPRAAEQISGVMVLPLILLIFGQIAGLIVINPSVMLGVALALLFIDAALIYAGARLFQREVILTRWK